MSHRRTTMNGAVVALLSALALSLASCAQPLTTREKGTLAGAPLGPLRALSLARRPARPGRAPQSEGPLGLWPAR
jgi:hypothetical protein